MNSLRISSTAGSKWFWLGAGLILLVLVSALLSLGFGAVALSPKEVFSALLGRDTTTTAQQIVRFTRLPRTCGALLAGSALSVSGVIIQQVLANPLAAPNVIGVNAGAGFVVALSCAVLPKAITVLPVLSFVGALCGVLLVLFIGERTGASRLTLVLAGVAISSLFTAGVDAVVTFVPEALSGYSDFRIGGLSNVSMARILPAAALILPGLALAISLAGKLDVLMLGSEVARSLGLNVKPLRLLLLVIAAALAGAAVSFSGLLGFVGLIVPHIFRRLVGDNCLPLMVCSALGGAAFLTLCDLASRTLFAPYEIPVGIVLSFVGGPFFLWLLFHQRRHHHA